MVNSIRMWEAAWVWPAIPLQWTAGNDDDTVVAWQFMLGLAYALTKQVELQGGFRYLGTADLEVERTGAMFAYQTYGFDFGATYRF